jgi:hypothetical protein
MIASDTRFSRQPVLQTTDRDHATALLLATLFCLTALATGLMAIWISHLSQTRRHRGGTGGSASIDLFTGAPVPAQALAVHPPEDLTDDPSLEKQNSVEAELTSILEQVGEANVELIDEPHGARAGGDGNHKTGQATAIRRPNDDTRPQRWFFNFNQIARTEDYTRLLDQLDIELGSFDESGFVYLTDITKPRPGLRRPTTNRDNRFYTVWQSGTLLQIDRQLFQTAGVQQHRSKQVLHFFSPALEAQLAALELAATKSAGRKLKHVRRTWFTAIENAGQFTFKVTNQNFL